MKILGCLWVLVIAGLAPLSAQGDSRERVKIELVGGDTITGTVSSSKNGSVSVITSYGVIRIPVEKLTAESRKKLGISEESSIEELRKRISELEELVARLRAENAQLRKSGSGSTTPSRVTPSKPATTGKGFWISSTGKRHNSRCRYYKTSRGREGSGGEGIPCKICGG